MCCFNHLLLLFVTDHRYFLFVPFFSPQHYRTFFGVLASTSWLLRHPWLLNLTAAAIICHYLGTCLEKGKRKDVSADWLRLSCPPLPTHYHCLGPVTWHIYIAGTCDIIVIFIRNGYDKLVLNPGQGCLHFTEHYTPGKGMNPTILSPARSK